MGRRVTTEFHISRKTRERYAFDDTLFSLSGNVISLNPRAARLLAQKINEKRDLARFPEQAVKAGQISAMGLIDEILHYVVALYREQISPSAMEQALDHLCEQYSSEEVDKVLYSFVDEFPPIAVYRKKTSAGAYLKGSTAGTPIREIVLEEMLMLWLANMNPAFSPFLEFFDDTDIKRGGIYLQIISGLAEFFQKQPGFGPDNQNLIDMLRSPATSVPHSLKGQIEFIMERWGALLGRFVNRLLGALDLIKEEEKIPFTGPGPAEALALAGLELESEQFSPDREWMPRLVLMAKNIYVWMDQLSKKYGYPVTAIDRIPDEELTLLTNRGITGLWLIGVWERSPVSQKIKQLCGNPEAVASAYSLFDYTIAEDLGGEEAYENLKKRAWEKGIRLASDMVPNHVGIFSRWVVEHPDWFISLDYNPFPWYTFGGLNLSPDERVGVHIEDHYYNRTDAAVVFKRTDLWTGSEKYFYHGNDGTSMPWNDTAQLNYLNPELREAMIRTILHVARKFPVIRFDAAMTLTKRHYQRLWFPEPGSGGAIPTRTEYGLTKEEFDAGMPNEFWREVVDRIAAEAPDTLLLAEAFWLLEGYFVRTLGMHRVYNSAFMNMLRDENNAGYRAVMKNVLEFDPEILRRLVNFMNNPDERTAVEQFGKDDKYLGVCTLMVTMPGLPMLGHGQVEGLGEKYGMEYKRAYWNETPDQALIERHELHIFPLLHRRYLFAGVENFLLYDFFTARGTVNEDVFAYSNRSDGERALVVYHNRNNTASGWIKVSVAYSIRGRQGGARELVQKTLGEGLGLNRDEDSLIAFRDHSRNLEYIRFTGEIHEKGLYAELGPYACHVFVDFREVRDDEGQHYSNLAKHLNGRGVPSIEGALKDLMMQPMHNAFRELINSSRLQTALGIYLGSDGHPDALWREFLAQTEQKAVRLLREVKHYTGSSGDEAAIAGEIVNTLEAILKLPARMETGKEVIRHIHRHMAKHPEVFHVLYCWSIVHSLGKISQETGYEALSRAWMDELLLGRVMEDTFKNLGFDEAQAWQSTRAINLLITHQGWYESAKKEKLFRLMKHMLNDGDVRLFIHVNHHEDILWFSKEGFEELLFYMLLIAVIQLLADQQKKEMERDAEIAECYSTIGQLQGASEKSGYKVQNLLEHFEKKVLS